MPPKSPIKRSPAKKTVKKPVIASVSPSPQVGKRKAVSDPPDHDSDIEILETKKAKVAVRPVKMSLCDKIDKLLKKKAAASIAADTTNAPIAEETLADNLISPSPSRPRSSRTKVLTEKALVIENIRAARAKKIINSDEDSGSDGAMAAAEDEDVEDTQLLKCPDFTVLHTDSDGQADDGIFVKSPSDEGASNDVQLSPCDANNLDASGDGLDPQTAVTCMAVQDRDLRRLYKDLPELVDICELAPFSQNAGVSTDRVEFEVLAQQLSAASVELIIGGLMFERSGFFVNTARVHPNVLTVESRRLRIAGTTQSAVGVMIGVVTECYLVEEGTSPYLVYKITIVPFAQDMRRDTALWGQLFSFRSITASVSADGISFLTRKQGGYVAPTSAPSSPRKKSSLFKTVASPMVSAAEGSRGIQSYPPSRGFDDKVPIYDGRAKKKPFTFTDEDFRDLTSWPLYRQGTRDLPADAVVAVGYTLNTYAGMTSLVLSSNIQFVVLLVLPSADQL